MKQEQEIETMQEPKTFKNEERVVNALKKLLNAKPNTTQKIPMGEHLSFMNTENTMQVTATSAEAISALSYFTGERMPTNELHLAYYLGDSKTVLVSPELLSRAVNVLQLTSKTISVHTKSEYPFTVQDEHFKIIIAPKERT